MGAEQTISLDRRQRRRQETIEEVLDVAAAIIGEQGAGGLSIGEVARRMGIRPPSLYVYFPSKHALYDALFARGAHTILDTVQAASDEIPAQATLEEVLLAAGTVFVRWAVEHPAYAQLLFWRPVPGFTPSPDAYAPAVEMLKRTHQRLADLQARGLIRDDVPVEQVRRDWTVLISGVVSQQLANAPDEGFAGGQFTAALPELVRMFARHYAATPASAAPAPTLVPTRRRRRHADNR